MTEVEIAGLGPALTDFLRAFAGCFFRREVLDHFRCYCRGLLSDLSRKSVEPIALAGGATVRSLQEFLAHLRWDQAKLRDLIQQRVAVRHADPPGAARLAGDVGLIGLIDECAQPKKGAKTPGVQRQHCGASGKIDNCIVNVHLGCVHPASGFQTLLDADLFLPQGWADDRDRCRAAHIPDGLTHRTKTQIALAQVQRALANGLRFDFLTFDEDYGKVPAFLFDLEHLGQTYVAEVPKSFRCWPTRPQYHSLRKEFAPREVYNVVRWSPAFIYQPWQTVALPRRTLAPQRWEVKAAQVYLRHPDTPGPGAGRPSDRTYWLIAGWQRDSDAYKYWLSNAPPATALPVLLKVAFSRAAIEHLFRIAKSEVGLDHYEGRSYVGLLRHLMLCQLVLLFLAEQTQRLNAETTAPASPPLSATRGGKGSPPRPDHGADGPGTQRPLPTLA